MKRTVMYLALAASACALSFDPAVGDERGGGGGHGGGGGGGGGHFGGGGGGGGNFGGGGGFSGGGFQGGHVGGGNFGGGNFGGGGFSAPAHSYSAPGGSFNAGGFHPNYSGSNTVNRPNLGGNINPGGNFNAGGNIGSRLNGANGLQQNGIGAGGSFNQNLHAPWTNNGGLGNGNLANRAANRPNVGTGVNNALNNAATNRANLGNGLNNARNNAAGNRAALGNAIGNRLGNGLGNAGALNGAAAARIAASPRLQAFNNLGMSRYGFGFAGGNFINNNFWYRNYGNGWNRGFFPWFGGLGFWPGWYWGMGMGGYGMGYGGYGMGGYGMGGYGGYYNPYYMNGGYGNYNYSQPIPAVPNDVPQTTAQQAMADFDQARAAFKNGDASGALQLVNNAIQLAPSDAALHEFRALVLFAQHNYPQAAESLYAVLAAGPGFNWQTVWELYPNEQTYTQDFRDLENYVQQHPDNTPAHFVLAYHDMVLNHLPEAAAQFQIVVQQQPKDQLSKALLDALNEKLGLAPAPANAGPEQTIPQGSVPPGPQPLDNNAPGALPQPPPPQ